MNQIIFWLAVFGNLVLAYYAIKSGLQALGCFARNEASSGFYKLSLACVLLALAALFPESLISGERESGKIGLDVCLLTPFIVAVFKLWSSEPIIAKPSSLVSGATSRQQPQMVIIPAPIGGLFPSDDLSNPANPLWPGHHS
jgi:hypothetical protein